MNGAVAQIWRDVLVSADEWDLESSFPTRPGIHGGCWMKCVQTGRIAWMKPAAGSSAGAVAANEKIASDLAHELNLSVPPVLLYMRAPDACRNLPDLACLSLVCHPKQVELQDLLGMPAAALTELLRPLYDGRIYAFDAWLGNIDRHNGRNILVGEGGEGSPELLFIDFSHSMGWEAVNLGEFAPVILPACVAKLSERSAVEYMAAQIEAVPDAVVDAIIRRIPDEFLGAEARELHMRALKLRKKMLVESMSTWYPKN